MSKEVGLRGRMDLVQFNAGVQSFMKSIQDMNKEVAKVAKESAAAAKSAGDSAGFLGVNWQRVKDIVTGITVIDVFRQISRALKAVVADALDATAEFQTLQIQLQAILARDFAQEFGVSVGVALGQVTEKTQELISWVRRVAVTTPFSPENLARALAYGQAFGFNVAQAKRLTLATGDFAAGMGLTNEHMQRIIYNFGQMLASGRVLGRELRDLANNFVPIREITQLLADEVDMPFEEMKKAMSKGRVSAEQFIGAFIRIAEEDFPGAMERMARTITGVRQNIKDFIRTLLGLELLGPVMERVAALLADALDRAFQPDVLRGFFTLGQVLLKAFEGIRTAVSFRLIPAIQDFFKSLGFGAPTVFTLASALLYLSEIIRTLIRALSRGISGLANFINTLSQRFNTTFAELIQNAAGWGFNIIRALAEGMAKAVTVVIQVLTQIAKIFTYWLRGSSPPRLLPDLPEWGKAAMQSWLKGWTSADFGIFDDIAGTVEAFLRSLAHKIPEKQLIPRILGSRQAIQNVINDVRKFGDITEGSINKIIKAMGIVSGPMKKFIRETIEFARISTRIEEAQKLLDFDVEFFIPTKILGVTVKTFEDLIRVANKFKGSLGQALKDYAQSLIQVAAADQRVAEAQEFLNRVTEKYDKQLRDLRALQQQFREEEDTSGRLKDIEEALATGLLTAEEKRRLELEKEQILLEHKIAAVEAERDIVVGAAEDRLSAEQEVAEAVRTNLEFQQRLAEQIAEEQLAAAKEQLTIAQERVQMEIETNQLIQEQLKLLERLAKEAEKEELLEIPGVDFEGFIDEFASSLEDSRAEITQAIQDLRNEIAGNIREFLDGIFAPFEGVPERLEGLLADIGDIFTAAQQNPAIGIFIELLKLFAEDVAVALGNLQTFWDENGDEILVTVGDFFTRLSELITPALGLTLINVGISIEKFGDFLVRMSEQLVENGPRIQESLQGWVDWVFDEGIPKLQDFGKSLKEDVIPSILTFVDALVANGPLILTILGALGVAFLGFRTTLQLIAAAPAISSAITSLLALAKGAGQVILILGGFEGIKATVLAALGPVALILLGIAGVFVALKTNVGGFRDIIVSSFKAMKGPLSGIFEPLIQAFRDLQPALAELREQLAPLGALLVPVLKIIGGIILFSIVPAIVTVLALITGLVRGFVTAFTGLMTSMQRISQEATRIVTGIRNFVIGFINIIAGLFTGDTLRIKVGFQLLVSGIKDIITGLLNSIVANFMAQFNFITDFLGGFVEGVIGFFANLYDQLIGKSIIPDMLQAIVTAFTTFFADTITQFGTWISDVIAKIGEYFTDAVQAGKDFIQNLINGITDRVFGTNGLIEKAKEYISTTVKNIELLAHLYLAAGKVLIQNLLDGIRELFESAEGVYENVKTFIGETVTTITNLKDDFIEAGKNIILGLIEGLKQKAVALYDEVTSIIKKALGVAEEESEAESASKRTRRLAHDWMKGFILGIGDEASATERAIAKVFSDLMLVPAGMEFAESNASVDEILKKLKSLSDFGSAGSFGANFNAQQLIQPMANGSNRLLTQPSPNLTNVRNINVEVNPTYAQVQSEAGIYYDVRAALAHIQR